MPSSRSENTGQRDVTDQDCRTSSETRSSIHLNESSKTRLGKYELLLPPVGEGSEGLLYKAHCTEEGVPGLSCGELVALKRLRHIGREMRPDRFQRQAELLGKLNHPNIVRHKDSFVWRDDESDEG